MEYNIEVSVEVFYDDYYREYNVYLIYENPLLKRKESVYIPRDRMFEEHIKYFRRVEKILKNENKVTKMIKKNIVKKYENEMKNKELQELICKLRETKINITLEIKE